MSKALVYSESSDTAGVQILGVKATMMTQEEVLMRASGSIQAPLKKSEKTFLAHNASLPLPVPVVPCYGTSDSKPKPKTIMHQLNDNHLGTTNFRSTCSTCGLGSDMCCSKSAVHVMPIPVCPGSHVQQTLAICKATCFACSRFLSADYETQLACTPIMDYDECATTVHEKGKMDGGRLAIASVREAAHRYAKFLELSVTVQRKMYKAAAKMGLSAVVCEHCGMIQPSDMSIQQKVICTAWDLRQTVQDPLSGEMTVTVWRPGKRVLDKLFHILAKTRLSDQDCDCCTQGDTAPRSIDALQWICSRLAQILHVQASHQDAEQAWLVKVMPFLMGGQVLQNTLANYYTYANIAQRFKYLREEDLWRMGKSPVYSNPKNYLWTNLYIADKLLRPIVQETSGGMIRANDPRTVSYETIIKHSAKLRETMFKCSKTFLESWRKMLKYETLEAFLANCFANPKDIFWAFEYFGDVRTGLAESDANIAKYYSNLQSEVTSIFDHTAEPAAKESHNSAATGVKNARTQARAKNRQVGGALDAENPDNEDGTLDSGEQNVTLSQQQSPTAKRKAKPQAKSRDGAGAKDDHHNNDLQDPLVVPINVHDMPCPCQLSKGTNHYNSTIDYYGQCFVPLCNNDKKAKQFQWSVTLQYNIWLLVINSVVTNWDTIIFDRRSGAANFEAHLSRPLRLQYVAHVSDYDASILEPYSRLVLEQYQTSSKKNAAAKDKNLFEMSKIVDWNRRVVSVVSNPTNVNLYHTSTRLPSPEQLKTDKYRRSGNKSGSKAPSKAGGLKKYLDGKNNLLRYNVITKRVNFSARFVLVPCGTIPPDHVGVPYRFCLSQTHPVVVNESNLQKLQLAVAKARYWAFLNLLPDLGGVESVVTDEGIQITINNRLVPSEDFFDDNLFDMQQKKKRKLLQDVGEQEFVEQWGAPLQIGWTCNIHLQDGDQVIVSRPPALQRHNHCCLTIVAVPGFAIKLLTSSMNGWNADADGDAMMVTIMQSISAKASIRVLMSLASNMMCPRKHAIICALQQDALLGACLLISESDRFLLDKREACKLASCYRLIPSSRFNRVGFKGRGQEWIDPKTRYGNFWRHAIPKSKNSSLDCDLRMPAPKGKLQGKPYWTGIQFFEESLPRDFCFFKRLENCPWSVAQVLSFISDLASFGNVDRFLAHYYQDGGETIPDSVVVIWRGRWVCGVPNDQTLSTSSGGIIESLWRNYGKNFACDWMGDICMLAQTYLSEIRGFSCSIADMIIGGRSNFSMALVDKSFGNEANLQDEQVSESAWPEIDCRSSAQASYQDVSKLSYLRHVERQREHAMNALEKSFLCANTFLHNHCKVLTYDDVSVVRSKLAEYANMMVMYGANMFAAHNNRSQSNNISLMAKTGSKGNSTNTAMISATLGVAKIKGSRAIGHDVLPTTRTFMDEYYGERTASSLGFISRGFIVGMTGKQFFQTSREARNRIKNSSDPSVSGYLQTKVGVNSQSVSVRMDGTVRNQQGEIVQINYGGDGYDACKTKKLYLSPEMLLVALEAEPSESLFAYQLNSILALVLKRMVARPEHDFASSKTLLARGFKVILNVDVQSLFLLHAGTWHCPSDIEYDQNKICTVQQIAEGFQIFCARVLGFDPTRTLMPFDLFLAVRIYLTPQVFGPMGWCTRDNLVRLLDDVYTTYCENMVDPGESVGPLACQSTNQPMTQLTMKSFKTDVAKATLHLGTGMSRVTELFGFVDPKAAIATIVLSPDWVISQKQADFVASQLVGTMLSEWVLDDGFLADWIDLTHSNNPTTYPGLYQATCTILSDYQSHRAPQLPQYHEICLWRLRPDFMTLPGVSQYLALFINDDESMVDHNLVVEALLFVEQTWKACLLPNQMGGIIIEPNPKHEGSLDITLWMAFRHCEKDLSSAMFCEPNQKARLVAPWMQQMNMLVADLTFGLCIIGSPEVEQLLSCDAPSAKLSSMDDCRVEQQDVGLPDIAECFVLRFKSKHLMQMLSHPCVVDQLCYTSNLKEIQSIYGIEATSQILALEASKILCEDLYVQQRHLQLLADVMTSEGDVLAMTQHGLKRRTRTSFFAKMSFEDVTSNLIKGGLNAEYDAMEHIVPNIMFAQRENFIGSGSCRVLKPGGDDTVESLPADFQNVAIAPSECNLFNLLDFLVGASYA